MPVPIARVRSVTARAIWGIGPPYEPLDLRFVLLRAEIIWDRKVKRYPAMEIVHAWHVKKFVNFSDAALANAIIEIVDAARDHVGKARVEAGWDDRLTKEVALELINLLQCSHKRMRAWVAKHRL